MIKEKLLNTIFDQIITKKRIYSAVLQVDNSDGSFSWSKAGGNMNVNSRYSIASVTKLYVTAVVMRLIEENRITLCDKITKHLPESLWKGLHVLNRVDYSKEITISHLISNTSGLPDYFFHKQPDGKTVADNLMTGNDQPWPLDKTKGL